MATNVLEERFWEKKSLTELSDEEWEAVCDGCGRCCMIKLQDESTDEVHYTAMVCDLLDQEHVRCTAYPRRHELVPDCVVIDAERALEFSWLPLTCGYRTLAEGRQLPWWHPLISGDASSVVEAGISVKGRVVAESEIHPEEHEDMVVTWVEHT